MSSLIGHLRAGSGSLRWTRRHNRRPQHTHAFFSTREFTQATIASPNPPSPPPAGRDNTLAWVGLGLAALGVAVCMYAAYHLLCLQVKAKRRQAQAAVSTDFFVRRQHEGSEPPTGMPVVRIAIPPSTDPQPATEAPPEARYHAGAAPPGLGPRSPGPARVARSAERRRLLREINLAKYG